MSPAKTSTTSPTKTGGQQGSDPRTRAKDILTYGAAEEHADESYTIHPPSRISSVTVRTRSGPH